MLTLLAEALRANSPGCEGVLHWAALTREYFAMFTTQLAHSSTMDACRYRKSGCNRQ
jgi:hypothetical protein